jgi:hypothetical protein
VAQYDQDLIFKSIASQYRFYDDPSTLEKEYRSLYAYNGNSQVSKVISEYRSFPYDGQWKKTWEKAYTYNLDGQKTKIKTLNYNENQSLDHTTTESYRWDDNHLVERTYDVYWNENKFGHTEIEVFNSVNRKIQVSTIDYNDQGVTRESVSKNEYDLNGCLKEITNQLFAYDLADTINIGEKWIFTHDESCRPIQSEFWVYNYDSEIYELKYSDKYEFIADPLGNILYESYYEKTEGEHEDFILVYETFNTFDDNGNIVLTENFSDGFRSKVEMVYNEMNLSTETHYFFWNFNNKIWIPDFESYRTFDQDSNIIEDVFYYSYDTISGTFLGKSLRISQYNENNQQVSEEHHYQDFSNPNNPILEHHIIEYQYECNGRHVSTTSKELISKGGFISLIFYHDLPPCSKLYDLPLEELKVFPNPASEYIHFTINEIDEGIAVSIFNIDGALVYHSDNESGGLISTWVNKLENGTYLIKAETSNKTYLGKFIKI